MAEISAQDAHWAMDCRGGKSFHRIIELEIGSRPEIRRELNLINRNLHFITMTGKRSMTDILVSNRSELTHKLSKQTLNEKKPRQVRIPAKWQRESRVPVCSLLCKICTQYAEGEVQASHWPMEASSCLVIGQKPSHQPVPVYANFNSVGCDFARRKNAYLRAGHWHHKSVLWTWSQRGSCVNTAWQCLQAEASSGSGDDNWGVMDTGERSEVRTEVWTQTPATTRIYEAHI